MKTVKKYQTGGSAKAVKATANNAATNTSKKTPTKIPAKPVKRTLPPAPKPKTGMDALKALGKYITTFGFATEGYNPAPSKKAKKTMKNGGGIKAKKK